MGQRKRGLKRKLKLGHIHGDLDISACSTVGVQGMGSTGLFSCESRAWGARGLSLVSAGITGKEMGFSEWRELGGAERWGYSCHPGGKSLAGWDVGVLLRA